MYGPFAFPSVCDAERVANRRGEECDDRKQKSTTFRHQVRKGYSRMPETIEKERFINATPQRVFQALTERADNVHLKHLTAWLESGISETPGPTGSIRNELV
jgi:hypothetical protein